MTFLAGQAVTWVKVEPPTLDVVGLVLTALGLAGVCAVVALVLGISLGVGLVIHRRKHPPLSLADEGLHLMQSRRPS
ncbi:MAG TPA: hypothetical protein VII13_19345 [Vicinamibacteria bacterium]|jgi:hypothetical protein